jgi:hypothetical protein
MTLWTKFLPITLLLAVAPAGYAAAQSGTDRDKAAQRQEALPVLVELFTSEGCSSCPPADALLRKLEGMRTDTGQRIVALSEHVTYWNRLGWADPFSAETFSDRQNDYGERFHLDDIYTPQAIVNGDREVNGSDGEAILRAVRLEGNAAAVKLEILNITAGARALSVTYSLSGTLPPEGAEVYVALADDQDTSYVGRGENAGLTLKHVSVARSLTRMVKLWAPEQRTVTIPLPESPGAQYAGGRHVVVFVQLAGLGKVLAIASQTVPATFPTAGTAVAAVH